MPRWPQVSVGLLTERGTVRVSHLWAEEVRLATQAGGDIIFRGSVEGNIRYPQHYISAGSNHNN